MYIKFCINKIKLRDLEIHTAKYNDTYIYDKKYYVLYKIPFHFFFIAEIVLVLDQNFIKLYTCQWNVQNVITLVIHLKSVYVYKPTKKY